MADVQFSDKERKAVQEYLKSGGFGHYQAKKPGSGFFGKFRPEKKKGVKLENTPGMQRIVDMREKLKIRRRSLIDANQAQGMSQKLASLKATADTYPERAAIMRAQQSEMIAQGRGRPKGKGLYAKDDQNRLIRDPRTGARQISGSFDPKFVSNRVNSGIIKSLTQKSHGKKAAQLINFLGPNSLIDFVAFDAANYPAKTPISPNEVVDFMITESKRWKGSQAGVPFTPAKISARDLILSAYGNMEAFQ